MNLLMSVNDVVKVKLTPLGFRMHRERHDSVFASWGTQPPVYVPPRVDFAGWSEFQLHDLMLLYGPAMNAAFGADLPFGTEIRIEL